jgi:multiple sugar transport system permease protein
MSESQMTHVSPRRPVLARQRATGPGRGAGPRPGTRHRRGGLAAKRRRAGIALVTPAFAFIAVFVLFPLVFAIYVSLTNWPLVGPYHLIGVTNYVQLPSDPTFLHSILFTVEYTAIVTPAIFILGYALAMFVRKRRPGSTLFRTIFFAPFIIGLATESYIAVLDLQPHFGIADVVLSRLGLASLNTAWLVNTGLALTATCVLVTWFASGLTMLLLVGGMQGIPAEVYDAAAVDGVSWWQREWHITLPLLRPTIALSLIISVIGSFLAFNQFYILTQGGPGTSTDTIVMWIYQVAFVQLHLGKATAMAIVLVAAVGLISFLQFILLRDRTRT